ncbi:DUF1254 domain-containing protein [Kitasatospora griseola]|uniref:DUF1254 domain-containing protein n=1 Tax=Kitasatospora griseola TaxID=2064 RepID=UPI00167078BB|nr:DUF1254 domain-containing protein [Kitasatospora griseola]GGQ53983.1 hypothetical protein GCM10010195_06730 [Kitasatospora griseola]
MAASTDPQQDPLAGATDLYVFGYALLMMELTRRLQTNTETVNATQAPVNQFCQYTSPPTPEMKDVVRPNVDTLYTQAWIDLAVEPMVLAVPVMDDRYWLMQLMDAWSNTSEESPSSLTPLVAPVTDSAQGIEIYTYALTGPGWAGEIPEGIKQIAFPTDTVWLIGRTELHNLSTDEVQTVVDYQDQMRLMPLSAWTDSGAWTPPNGHYDPNVPTTPPSELITQLSGTEFFDELSALLERTPLDPPDDATSALLADFGVHPHDESRLPDAATLDAAKDAGLDAVSTYQGAPYINGWKFAKTDIGAYGTDYLQRANIAMFGLGANLPQDALYPSTFNTSTDADGAPIAYTLTFPAGQLPPVDAFWSLTAYDASSFLVENSENIYAIGHFAPPVADPGTGATTLYVQAEEPADPGTATANWLPIPTSGDFSVTLRLYAPQTDDILADWPPALTPAPAQD